MGDFVIATWSGDKESWEAVLAMWTVALVIAIPIAFLAVPLFYVSLKFRRTSILDYVAAGIAISLLDMAVFALQQSLSSYRLLYFDFRLAVGAIAVAGPVAMVTLWKVARPGQTGELQGHRTGTVLESKP